MGYGYDLVQQPSFPATDRGLLAVASIINVDADGLHPIQWEPDWCSTGGAWSSCVPGAEPLKLTAVQDADDPFLWTFTADNAKGTTAVFDFADGTAPVTVDVTGNTEPDANPNFKTFADSIVSTALPFAVYDGIDCSRLGLVNEEERARKRLSYSEQYQAERCFWTGEGGAFPYLADKDVTTVLADKDAAVDLAVGVGMLEKWLADNVMAIGVLHASREVSAWAADRWLFNYDNSTERLRTALNTGWAMGSGYPNTGPDGTDPGDGKAWIYATGPVVVRRSNVSYAVNPVDPRSNRVVALAERQYVITYECAAAAVCVTAPGGTTGGS